MSINENIEKLRSYHGCTPKPDDFEQFWKDGLAELDTVDPQPQLQKADFQVPGAECFDLWFTSTHGARIYAKYIRPQNADPHPAVLNFHGYCMNSGDWSLLLPYVMAGFSVAAMDCRGQSGRSLDTEVTTGISTRGSIIKGLLDSPDKLLFRNIFLDTVQLFHVVSAMPEVDADRIGVTGISQGGGLSLACAALVPQIKVAAVLYPFLSDYKMAWDLNAQTSAFFELKPFFRQMDPTHSREEELFTKLGYIDVHHLTPYIRASTHVGITMLDESVPPATQFAAYNGLQCPKTLTIYKDYGHEPILGFADAALQKLMELYD